VTAPADPRPADRVALRRKALAVLREGRLTVHEAAAEQMDPPHKVVAFVRSSRDPGRSYVVDLMAGTWSCTCGAGGGLWGAHGWGQQPECAHITAARLVCGAWLPGPVR
jgi:hypothetical protein